MKVCSISARTRTVTSGALHTIPTLYSKFCPATIGFHKFFHHGPKSAQISPQAPPQLGFLSKALKRACKDLGVGTVPTSRRTQTFGFRTEPKALKNHRWELSFFALFSLRPVRRDVRKSESADLIQAIEEVFASPIHSFLLTEQDLHWDSSEPGFSVFRQSHLTSILKHMRFHILPTNRILCKVRYHISGNTLKEQVRRNHLRLTFITPSA